MHKFLEQLVPRYMTREPRTITRDMTMRELGELFEKEDFNAYPVTDGGQVLGIVSKFDYLSCFVFTPPRIISRYRDLMQRRVADLMTSEFIYVLPETRLTRVLELMVNHRLRSMQVASSRTRVSSAPSAARNKTPHWRCTMYRGPLPAPAVLSGPALSLRQI